MIKRTISIFTIIIFIITMLPLGFIKKVQAYSSPSYFNDLKVGLISMSSPSMTLTLNGSYTLNGQSYPSGTVLCLGISGTSITVNGTLSDTVNLIPNSSSNLLTIASNSISNKYIGSFLIKIYNSKLLPINTINIEDYLKGVVPYEMSDYFPLEALKAQAVAARNYALSRIGFESSKGYDFDDTINYQVYKGYNSSYTNAVTAVNQTKGKVLLYNNTLVETLYSAWHGGISENSENVWGNIVPYLRSVQDPYEGDGWPNGSIVLTNTQIQSTLISKKYLSLLDTFVKVDLSSITRFLSGRVSNINIIYKDSLGILKTKSVTKDSTRTFLSLPSSLYTVSYNSVSGSYTFSGKGYGHGLGMSQIGAKNRGSAGQTYDEILKFYYQNTYIESLILKASLNSLTVSSNALFTGDTVSFNSEAAGGNGYGYLYKFIVKNDSGTVFSTDYTNVSSLNFTPSTSGNYTVESYIKDKFSTEDYDDKKICSFTVYNIPSINDFTLSKTETLVSQGISANVDIQDGSGSYLYKYEISKDGTIIQTRDFSTDKQFTYTPDKAGTYTMTSYIKDTISNKDYDLTKSQSFTVYDPLNITSFTKDNENILLGNNINFITAISGGSGTVLYKFMVMKDNETIYTKDYDSNSTFSYTPSLTGSYNVYVYTKDKVSSNEYDAVSKVNFNVYNPALSKVTVNGSFYQWKNLSFIAESTGVSPAGFSYKYEVFSGTTLITSSNYSNSNTFNFTPASPGIYTVNVYGKDGLSTKPYDSIKQFTITINPKPLSLSILPLKYGMTNSSVAALQSALIKLNYTSQDASGYFGTKTKSSVISFQTSKGLTADGIVGNITYNALNDALIAADGNKSLTF